MTLTDKDVAWVDAVYRECCADVFRVCRRFAAGDHQWALDRTHEVFMHLIMEMGAVRDRDQPRGWLYRVAVHVCGMDIRRRNTVWKYLPFLRSQFETTIPSAERQTRARMALSEFDRAVCDLPGDQRAVMVLVYIENKSQSEAAELLHLSKGQVSKLHKRAIATLQARDWDVDDA